MTCELCDSKPSGWWGPGMEGRTHCRRCHRTWKMRSIQAHCVANTADGPCCSHFTSNTAAELHWVKDKGHTPPADVAGLYRCEDEFGDIWHTAPELQERPGNAANLRRKTSSGTS